MTGRHPVHKDRVNRTHDGDDAMAYEAFRLVIRMAVEFMLDVILRNL
jgi:hypothetical protein